MEVKNVNAYFYIAYFKSTKRYFSSSLFKNIYSFVFYGISIILFAAIMLNVSVRRSENKAGDWAAGAGELFLKVLIKMMQEGQHPSNTDESTEMCFIGLRIDFS